MFRFNPSVRNPLENRGLLHVRVTCYAQLLQFESFVCTRNTHLHNVITCKVCVCIVGHISHVVGSFPFLITVDDNKKSVYTVYETCVTTRKLSHTEYS